jgi:5-formyltetrahydrofolate cyclo-ligase
MRSHELKRAKRDVRRRVLALRDALTPSEREALGARIHASFLGLPEVEAARTVLLFWSFGSEVPTAPLLATLADAGRRVVLPRIAGDELALRTYAPGEPLTATSFGAMEPAGGDPVEPDELDAIGVPAVAFDGSGRRVGYGGGFYDRLFPRASRASRIGLAFGVQVVSEELPAGHFDLRVDVLVTEEEVFRWSR